MGGGAWPFLVGGAICLVNSVNERDLSLLTSYVEVSLHGQLLRGTMAFPGHGTRVDYVPALCTHRPSLLPIEWSGEVLGSRRRGRFAAGRRRENSTEPYHLEEGEVVTRGMGLCPIAGTPSAYVCGCPIWGAMDLIRHHNKPRHVAPKAIRPRARLPGRHASRRPQPCIPYRDTWHRGGDCPNRAVNFRPRLNTGVRPIANKYREGKMKKDFEKRVKECLKLSGGKRMGAGDGVPVGCGTAIAGPPIDSGRGPVRIGAAAKARAVDRLVEMPSRRSWLAARAVSAIYLRAHRDVAADGNVRESGDVGGGLGKSYLFCLTACPPWKRLSRRQGKSAKWIRNLGKRIGSEGWARGYPVPNPSAVGGLLELLPRRERVAACRPGDGLGTAPSGAFPGRRTANSELRGNAPLFGPKACLGRPIRAEDIVSRIHQVLDCSPTNRERELGLDRRETESGLEATRVPAACLPTSSRGLGPQRHVSLAKPVRRMSRAGRHEVQFPSSGG
ncbi:hypothetical protein L1887_61115 [Cichorium endivia]|nr:hypothetical protein L1887_61115 [Cichorium endivia]